jgi:DNA-binding CsgD family transcriptional regulator
MVGRSSQCDLVVNDVTISRRHAEIILKDSFVFVRDLGSLNGTYVDDRPVGQCCVCHGQPVRFGRVAFTLTNCRLGSDEPDSNVETGNCHSAGRHADMDSTPIALSTAQHRVFQLILNGLAEKQIARRLRISRCTVHNHIQAIYRSLDVHSRCELLARFVHPHNRKELSPHSQ